MRALGASATPGRPKLTQVDTLKSELSATETDRGTLVSLPGDVLFDFDKATIRADARPTLDKLAQLIKAQNPGMSRSKAIATARATMPITSACHRPAHAAYATI